MILDKHFQTLTEQITGIQDELVKLRGDIQQEKTASRAAKKRDWRIIKLLKGGR